MNRSCKSCEKSKRLSLSGIGLTLFLGVLLCISSASAQISAGGTPPSFTQSISAAAPTVQMAPVDNQAELVADRQAGKDAPYRFATSLDVSLNLHNSGVWTTLPNGDRLWQLRISSPGAYSIGLIYNDWYIPKGGQLFIYNDDHSKVIGAFTSFNNWSGPTNITQHVAGDAITLEYLEPAALAGQSRLSISKVAHAYRSLFGSRATENFGDSGPCEININCPIASGWQTEKHGVAMLIINNTGGCSGSLINNTSNNYTPYFLTANHCTNNFSDSYVLYFNYESPNCNNINGPLTQTVANGFLDATYSNSDFSLIGFSGYIPATYSPYFNGWNRVNSPSTNSTCIHHPSLDIMKISHDNNAPGSYGWNAPGDTHWHIFQWDQFGTSVGVTEPGSSGSPLFDQNGLITGQLHGGLSACGNPIDDYYGKVAYSWDGGGTNTSRLSNWLDPNNTGVTTLGGLNTPLAGNDVCPGYDIFSLPYSDNGNTIFADNNYPHQVFGTSPDVVYTLQLACSTLVTASLCGSGFDTGLDIRTGGACPGSTVVTFDDDFCSFAGPSQVTFTARPNVVYYMLVYGYGSAAGPFTLNVTGTDLVPAPVNDVCPGITVNTLPYSGTGTTCNATANYNTCVTSGSPDVVYTINVPSCQTVTVSLCGSDFDTQLSVYAGGTCPGTYLVACNDDYCGDVHGNAYNSQLEFVAQANTNYYVIIGGYAGATGNYVINVSGTPFTPPNDVCPGTTIASLPYTDFGNTGCATHNYAVQCRNTNSPDVVYNFTPSVCESLTVSLCGSGYDCLIDVRAGGDCPGSVSVACNDDNAAACGTGSLQSQVTFRAYAGVTYYFIVSGFGGNAGPFVLNAYAGPTFTPSNDVCPGTVISALPFTDINSTACDAHNYNNFQGNSSPDAVYQLTSATCQNIEVSLCGSGYDTGLSVYKTGACPGTVLVAGNDDNLCGGQGTYQSTLGFQATAGVTYYILVHGFSTASGPFVINVTGTPCNTTATVDSLVIIPSDPFIILAWKFQGPAYMYYIYRSTSPTGLVAPANKLDSTTVWNYFDGTALSSSNKYFYAVTAATLPTFLTDGSGAIQGTDVNKATAAATSEPWFATDPYPNSGQPEVDKPAAVNQPPVFLPAYQQFSSHYTPNPNKHTDSHAR